MADERLAEQEASEQEVDEQQARRADCRRAGRRRAGRRRAGRGPRQPDPTSARREEQDSGQGLPLQAVEADGRVGPRLHGVHLVRQAPGPLRRGGKHRARHDAREAGHYLPGPRDARSWRGLRRIDDEIERGIFYFRDVYEDVHLNVEARLIEIVGRRRRQAAHRPLPERPDRPRHAALHQGRHQGHHQRTQRPPGPHPRQGRGPHRRRDAGLHAHAARTAGLARASPPRLRRNVRAGYRAVPGRAAADGRDAAGKRRLGRLALSARPSLRGAAARLLPS